MVFRRYILAGLLFCYGLSPAYSEVKVGVIAGLTGDWAAYGMAAQRGIQMAGNSSEVEFIFEDDQFQPARSVSAFRKLHEQDRVSAIIVSDTATAMAVAPLAHRVQMPLFVWANENPIFVDKPCVIRMWGKQASEISASQELLKIPRDQNTLILHSEHPYTNDWGAALKSSLGSLASVQALPGDISDFRNIILRAKSQEVESIVLCLNPGQGGRYAAQLAQLAIKQQIFACSFLESTADLQAANGALDGAKFVTTDIKPQFVDDYVRLAGTSDHVSTAAVHYDTARALLIALKRQEVSQKNLIDEVYSLGSFSGAHRSVKLVKDAHDIYLDFPFALAEIRDKQMHIVAK